MMHSIAIIDRTTHSRVKIKENSLFLQMRQKNMALVQVHEFLVCASRYPIVFVKDAETGEFQSVALLGLAPEENLYWSEQGWDGAYIPSILRAYPFLLAPIDDNLHLCIDTQSPLVNEVEGNALFAAEGHETEFLQSVKQLLGNFASQAPVTAEFVRCLADKRLLAPLNITVQSHADEPAYQLNGLYGVDVAALDALSDEATLELKHKHYLQPIFAHIASLTVIDQLLRKKVQR